MSKKLNPFIGTWQLEDSNTYEYWEDKGAYFVGRVIKIENADTLFVESLRIFSEKSELFYEATVPNQNHGKSIRFKLTKVSSTYFQFENARHDFPKKIIYNFKDKNKLRATISGNDKQSTFNYHKIN